ncbi:MAG: M48 family peptidase [Chryseobacterium sp.]|nr:MAG: M48 family peptidase [Chryseobacterium sp.]
MKIKQWIGGIAIAGLLTACVTNPLTGRRSVQLVSNAEINAMALQQYKQTLSKTSVVTGTADANRVKTVGNRIRNAAAAYYRSIGREGDLAQYNWEFNLIRDNQKNAWCMPGGKVAFYTGIMPICRDENGVAVVMGHEVAHALAGHANERVSQAALAQGLGQLGSQLLGGGAGNSSQWAQLFNGLYPLGAQGVLLGYGRSQELEADQMGLYMMAMAGYDPRQAPAFWDRMQAASGNAARPPEFLSTHPNPQSRRADLEKNMARAMEYYRAAGGR